MPGPLTIPYDRLLTSYPFIAPSKYTNSLPGKNILITGCSVGIGRATAKAFAATGANVAIVARREPEIQSLAAEIHATRGGAAGGKIAAITADVTAPRAAQTIVQKAEQELGGPIDVLVSVAGKARISPLTYEDEDLTHWWATYELNVKAPALLMRQVLPGMIARRSGVVLTVGSGVASLALPTMSAYSSSKAAITKVHEALVPELEGTGVLSFSLNPGMVDTELGQADHAFNREALDHPAVQAFIGSVTGEEKKSQAELPADTMVALVADPRAKALNGLSINADQDLESVLREVEKPNGGRVTGEALYRVRINDLVTKK